MMLESYNILITQINPFSHIQFCEKKYRFLCLLLAIYSQVLSFISSNFPCASRLEAASIILSLLVCSFEDCLECQFFRLRVGSWCRGVGAWRLALRLFEVVFLWPLLCIFAGILAFCRNLGCEVVELIDLD